MVLGPFISRNKGKKVVGGWAVVINKDLGFITGLIETGKVKPVIDKRYPLDRAAEAFSPLTGRKPLAFRRRLQ
jgi:NADPH:quinone reductase-like Zn-dependent oxidoreductase